YDVYVVWSTTAWSITCVKSGVCETWTRYCCASVRAGGVSALLVVAAFASVTSRSCQESVTSLLTVAGCWASVVTGLVSTTWLLCLLKACAAWSIGAQTFGEVQDTTVQ